jgi:uncharacterized protein YegJ (DUF2314 family)
MAQQGTSSQFFGFAVFGVAIAAFAALSGVVPMPDLSRHVDDTVVMVSRDDSEMLSARDKARATLPEFWKKLANPGPGETAFSVKLAIKDGENVEHMWCGDISGTPAKARCKINNEPDSVKTVALGQDVAIDPAVISDWMYMKNGRIKGGQSIRVLVSRMSEAEAASYKDLLADE